jgi:hypothetical protein
MSIYGKLTAVWIALAFLSDFGSGYALAQGPSATAELVQELQSAQTTDKAKNELLKLGKSDPGARKYLATRLPPLISSGPNGSACAGVTCQVWENEAKLAGELKIEEAAPALARWINWRTPAPYGLSMDAGLVFNPAATALVAIGDAAVPAVQDALDRGTASEHYTAIRVLCIMNSPTAREALRSNLQHETDPGIQAMTKRVLHER